ncbi:DUF1801 domain-containing protein [Hoeflea sp. EC-HK425]|uniref:iron chaperone n=1 Tax=Hoeflea sp. EC-HK425 TaxID=2038388 RepID=UPI0012545651|nr:DUF1801 domain-containing protein [Hoeflea sp. EC-HK425]VVT09294.1 Wenxma_21, whole genome shotgun sequence [Hoeflea sp. EC-HK425]
MARYSSIDDYIAHLNCDVQALAQTLRATIRNSAPNLVEAIRYDMPAFKIGDVTIIYFAFWKKHVGLYPIYPGTDEFEAEIRPYRAKTDTVQFRLNKPIPQDLVGKIVASQLAGSAL